MKWVLAFCLILVVLPGIIMYASGAFPSGTEQYYHVRVAELFSSFSSLPHFFVIDTMTFAGKEIMWTPFYGLTALSLEVFSWKDSVYILPILMMLVSVALFYILLQKEGFSSFQCALCVLVFTASPAVVYLETHWTPSAFAIPLLLAGVLVLRKQRILSTLLFGVVASLGIIPGLVCLGVLWAYGILRKVNVVIQWSFVLLILLANFLAGMLMSAQETTSTIIADLGGVYGFSSFALLLGILGLTQVWHRRTQHVQVYALIVSTFGIAIVVPELLPFLNIALAILAGLGINELVHMEWDLPSLKYITLVVLGCGLLFSGLSHVFLVMNEVPSINVVNGLVGLSDRPMGSVLSSEKNGFMIELLSKKAVITDSFTGHTSDDARAIALNDAALHASSVDEVINVLRIAGIKYIVITSDMYENVWEKHGEGLDFVLHNSDVFKRTFGNEELEIWEYVPSVSTKKSV